LRQVRGVSPLAAVQLAAMFQFQSRSCQGLVLPVQNGGLGLGGEFVKSGLGAPLDDFYKKYNWDARLRPVAAQYTSLYPPGRHGVPYTVNGEVLYYNKALFKKAGIDTPPQTYADLLGAAEKLKKAGIPAFTFGGSVNWHVMRLMDAVLEAKCGAQTHDALKAMTVKWSDSPCANDAFKDFHKWISDYTLKPFMSYDQVQSRKLFFADRAAMMLEGDWMVAQLRAEAKDPTAFAIFPFPTGTNRLYGFGTNLIINPNGKKDLAARFIDFYTSDKVQQENLGNFGALGINRNVAYKDADELDKAWLDIFAKSNATFVNGDQGFPLDVTTEYFRVWHLTVDAPNGQLRPNMPVVSLEGAVGTVLRAAGSEVDVQLTVDSGFGVDVVVERSGARGFVRGSGDRAKYAVRVEYVQRTDQVEVGDLLVTSGVGCRFPKGIPIARVTKVLRRDFGIYQTVEAVPTVDFSRLEEVLIIMVDTSDCETEHALPGRRPRAAR